MEEPGALANVAAIVSIAALAILGLAVTLFGPAFMAHFFSRTNKIDKIADQ